MKTQKLIETDEAQQVLQELIDNDPLKLRGLLASGNNIELKDFLEDKAKKSINIFNEKFQETQDVEVSREFSNRELNVEFASEILLTKKELAMIAIFKVTEMKVREER